MEPTITFHYYVILWNYQIRPCLFFYGPSLNLIRRQTPTLYHHIDLQKTRLSFIIVNQLKLYNYFCISVPLPLQDDHLNIGWYGSLECHHQKKKVNSNFRRTLVYTSFLQKQQFFVCLRARRRKNNKIINCRPTFFRIDSMYHL